MPRWAWFLPVGLLVLASGLMAYRYGWLLANMSETAAIETYSARYHSETGGAQTSCSAVPGQSVWLVIQCGQGDMRRVYRVNRFGGLVSTTRGERPLASEPHA